jgi:hypothetical protein
MNFSDLKIQNKPKAKLYPKPSIISDRNSAYFIPAAALAQALKLVIRSIGQLLQIPFYGFF